MKAICLSASHILSLVLWLIYIISGLAAIAGLQQLQTITFWPFQHEYREAAMATSAYGLLRGLAPFSWDLQPRYTNVYGPLLPLVVWLCTPDPQLSFIITRCISSGMILLNTLILFAWIWRTSTILFALPASTLFLYQQLFASSGAFSTSLGAFFFIAPLAAIDTLPCARKHSWITIPAAVLGFLSKPYFSMVVAVGGVLTTVEHFRQGTIVRTLRASLFFLLVAFFAFGLIVLLYAYVWPPLFTNTILHHKAVARFDASYRAFQLGMFWEHAWLLCVTFVALVSIAAYAVRTRILNVCRGMLSNPSVVAVVCSGGAFYWFMGGHSGAAPTLYLYHIFMPFFLVAWCKLAYFVANSLNGHTVNTTYHRVALMVGSVAILASLLDTPAFQRRLTLTQAQQDDWRAAQSAIESSKLVLHSAQVTSLIIQNELPLFDSGQSEYFVTGAVTPPSWRFVLPDHSHNVHKTATAFAKKIERDVKARLFDTLVLTQGAEPVSRAVIQRHYKVCRVLNLTMPLFSQTWVTQIYRRRGMC